jgi:hypothetical protein
MSDKMNQPLSPLDVQLIMTTFNTFDNCASVTELHNRVIQNNPNASFSYIAQRIRKLNAAGYMETLSLQNKFKNGKYCTKAVNVSIEGMNEVKKYFNRLSGINTTTNGQGCKALVEFARSF